MNDNDKIVNKKIDKIVNAGLIDKDSDPGNLTKDDIDEKDNLIYKKAKSSKTYTNMEDDTDKIGFILQISQDTNYIRKIGGYVFEDERNYENNKIKISIGNGYRESLTKESGVKGVTLQLVELIPEIDENGLAVIEKNNGRDAIKYKREIVIGTSNYTINDDGELTREGDYKSTIYQSVFTNSGDRVEVDQSGSYYAIDGFGYSAGTKNEDKYNTQNFALKTDVTKPETMYYYDLEKSNNIIVNHNRVRVSDAKDIYDDRIKATQYSLDLVNRNGEILSSYDKLKTDLKGKDEDKITQQEEAIDELMKNTKMRANTGVIQLEFNHNNSSTNEVDLGLVERAKAQTVLSKEVTNIKIVLANEEVLFNTDKSVNNLFFSKHTEHGIEYKKNKIVDAPTINEVNGEKTSELIQAYMDSEFINGASIELDYRLKASNVGEVDYLDQKYYYTGLEDDPVKNICKTTINKVIDYNSNTTVFKDTAQKDGSWKTVDSEYLINNGLVSKGYEDELKTYNTILVNENIAGETVPEMFKKSNSIDTPTEYTAELIMQADLGMKNIFSTMMYNNISEIVETKNMYGRKNAYSVPGNQELTDQRVLINAIQGKSTEDRMTPAEIDADSAQKAGILPPTGEKDYMFFTFIFTISLGMVLVGLFVIKGLVFNKKYNTKNK